MLSRTMQLRERSKGISKDHEKTEYEKMIEAQHRLGIGFDAMRTTRGEGRKLMSIFKEPTQPKQATKAPKLDSTQKI